MPKQIQTPSFGQALVRMFNLKGRYQPVLDETIVPVVLVERDAPATKKLANWGTQQGASGGGNQNLVFLDNPVNSGSIIVITKFWGLSGTPLTDTVSFDLSTGSPGAGIGEWRDSRLSGNPQLRINTLAAASAVTGFPNYLCDNRRWNIEFLLLPGVRLRIRQLSVNDTLETNWEWYEVPLTGGTEL